MAFKVGAMVLNGTEGFDTRMMCVPMSNQQTFFKDGWKILFPVVGGLDELGGACRLNTKP